MNTYKVPQWMCSKVDDLRAEGRTPDERREYAELVLDSAEEDDSKSLSERVGSFVEELQDTIRKEFRP